MLSTAIILSEQSVAPDKASLAASKKGLSLKELLQQTSHHNDEVRKGTVPLLVLDLLIVFLGIIIFDKNIVVQLVILIVVLIVRKSNVLIVVQIVILIVGTRDDVQPFVAIGSQLQAL